MILLSNMILRLILGWLWCLIHMAISLFDLWSCLKKQRTLWRSNSFYTGSPLLESRVIKESIEHGIETSRDENTSNFSNICANTKSSHCSHGGMVIECLSGSDGKEGIAKAANLLYSASCKGCNNYATYTHGYDKMDTVFTEADMASALRAIHNSGPELDLLLVYGPVRCHLGFPSWRLRYTEIMHMGPLKSMKYSSIVKVLCQFTQKHQNYGT
ncbi:hypothetical protein PVAP13_1KG104000 [Panicum virgatum]|uniref:Uncharacterized protein n=1 Tax=Panicum virgatum TaxID=38727 RepID=A0A8T0XDA7_PANVG|nr:hypothetical protein PVAP13_1KG104000 [Panicum virgatum]